MFAPVQPQLPSVVARAAAADASLFKPGQVLEALVLGKAPDGMVSLKIGEIVVTAQLPQTLPAGTTLQLQVKTGGPAPQLVIVGTPQPPVAVALASAPMLPNVPAPVSMPQPAQAFVAPAQVAPAAVVSVAVIPTAAAPAAVSLSPVPGGAPVVAAAPVPAAPSPPLGVPVVQGASPPQAPASPTAPTSVAQVQRGSVSPSATQVVAPQVLGSPPAQAGPSPRIVESDQPLAPTSGANDSRSTQPAQAVPAAGTAIRSAVVGRQPVVTLEAQPVVQSAVPQPVPGGVQRAAGPALTPVPSGAIQTPVAPSAPGQVVLAPSTPVVAQPPGGIAVPQAASSASAMVPQPPSAQVSAAPPSLAAVTAPAAPPALAAQPAQAAAVSPQVAAAAAQPAIAPQPAPQVAPQLPSSPRAQAVVVPAAEPEAASPLLVAQGAPRPQLTAADLPRPLSVPAPQVQPQAAAPTPAAALAQMVPQAMARQNSVAPLLASLATLVARPGAIPEPVLRAALQVLGQRVTIPASGPTAHLVETALAKSGIYLDAGLAKGAPAADLKSALVALKGAAATWLGGNPAPVTAANQSAPPLRGLPPRAEAAGMPQLPDAPRDAARVIHGQADAALSRVKLMQLASLPEADLARAPMPELRMEVPFLVGQQLVMAQFQVLRDREQQRADGKRGWTMRFAMNFAEAGEVGAEIGLLGRSVNVALWAADPETAADLEAALPELAPALAAIGLEPGAVRVRSLPPEPAKPQSGHFVDSRR